MRLHSREGRGKARARVVPAALVAALGMLWVPAIVAIDLGYEARIGAGYRIDELRWDIAGTLAGTAPNILSELTWRDVESAQALAEFIVNVDERLMLRARADYGEVQHGRVQDSDYSGDNRTLEFSRSDSSSGGHLYDAEAGVGYQFRVYDHSVARYALVAPMIGYARHVQHFTIFDGVQTIPAAGPINNLDSRYRAEWEGPWLGVHLRMEAGEGTEVSFEMQHHWADFYAEANWNLRTDLAHPVSFVHEPQGRGLVVTVELSRQWRGSWVFGGRLQWQDWRGDPGVDTIFDVSGDTPTTLATRLNGVDWESFAASLTASYRF